MQVNTGKSETLNGEMLTPQQARCCDLLIQDMADKEIAERMHLGAATVAEYLEAARHRLGSRSRVGLALRWNNYRKNGGLSE